MFTGNDFDLALHRFKVLACEQNHLENEEERDRLLTNSDFIGEEYFRLPEIFGEF